MLKTTHGQFLLLFVGGVEKYEQRGSLTLVIHVTKLRMTILLAALNSIVYSCSLSIVKELTLPEHQTLISTPIRRWSFGILIFKTSLVDFRFLCV